jgi:GH24 family phage-related lysozyme (muramidase)
MTNAISLEGLALIQEFEGFRAEPTQLPDGNWVVGFGHVRIAEAGAAVTEAEAADLLALDLAPVERLINTEVKQSLTPAQFDALVSFAFSVGAEAFDKSQVLRRANAGEWVAAACAMDAWRKSDVSGELEIIDALVRRRAAEKALFLKGSPHDASPSVFMRAKLDHAASILGAPIKYAPAPAIGSVPAMPPQAEPAQRIVEILKSEPATEALLLTQVIVDEPVEELTTAHAKPVARTLEEGRRALWREEQRQRAETPQKRKFIRVRKPTETAALLALAAFGLVLTALGCSTLVGGSGDLIDVAGASALAAPGVGAVLAATFALFRAPTPRAVRA